MRLLCVFLSGCSFLVSRPPDPPRFGAAPCHVSRAPAVFDTVEAAGGGALALWGLSQEEEAIQLLGAITGAVAAVYGASAAYGFRNVSACEDQRSRFVYEEAPIVIEEEEVEIQRKRTIRIWP